MSRCRSNLVVDLDTGYTAVLLPSRGIMISPSGIENMVPSNQKHKDQRVLLRLFFEVHKHLLVILNLLKVTESWVVWNVSICSNWRLEYVIPKLIAGIWEDMLVKGFMSDIHLPHRYFSWGVPHSVWKYTTSSTKGKGGVFYPS